MRRSKRFGWGLMLLTLLAASLAATAQTDDFAEKRRATLDARLQRLLQTSVSDLPKLQKSLSLKLRPEAEATVDVLVDLSGEVDLSEIPGVVLRSRIGNVATATMTPTALEMAAERRGVRYIEPAVRLKYRNDIATQASSGIKGNLASNAVDHYTYDAVQGQTLTVSVHPKPNSSFIPVFIPVLMICSDPGCTAPLISDLNPNSAPEAQVTWTFSSTGPVFITVSAKNSGSGEYALVYHNASVLGLALGIGAQPLHDAGQEGQGVIVGVIDTGIDWCHGDFIDDVSGKSRVLFLWDQNLTPQGGESAADVGADGDVANDYGVEYTGTQINAALTANDCALTDPSGRRIRSADTIGHGTHVAGIAAGDGSATNGQEPAGKYKGVARKADLIIVKFKEDDPSFFSESGSVIDAVAYIFAKARSLNKPAVINMSFGNHDGPIDGTSLLDQAVRNAVGPGRVVVAAAGNEGAEPIHAAGTITTSDTVTVDFTGCTLPACGGGIINLWHSGRDAYTVTVTAPNGNQLTAAAGTTQSALLNGTPVEILNAVSAPPNGSKNILIGMDRGSDPGPVVWSIKLQQTANHGSGKWDAWILPDDGKIIFNDGHVPKNPDNSIAGTVGELASSQGAITVGAHATNFRWDTTGGPFIDPEAFEDFGGIARFSSVGPTRDGRIKPDLTAPGFVVMSTASADCHSLICDVSVLSRDGHHQILFGTSMASPMVAGAAALILQADPNNFPRPLLKSSAARDTKTGSALPNNRWGAGKVRLTNVLNALNADQPPTVFLSRPFVNGATVTFSATASDPDPGDSISEYLWDFDNDGITDAITTAPAANKTYPFGTYTAKVTAVDQQGKSAAATISVTVNAPTSAPGSGDGGTTNGRSDGGGGGGGGCFIATAAYGSYLDPHVQTLRNFRDEVLMKGALGRVFVDFYYRWSPAAAEYISGRPLLKGTVRLVLTPVVFALENPALSGGFFATGLIMLVATIRKRREPRHAGRRQPEHARSD